jgi:hypothetical protein
MLLRVKYIQTFLRLLLFFFLIKVGQLLVPGEILVQCPSAEDANQLHQKVKVVRNTIIGFRKLEYAGFTEPVGTGPVRPVPSGTSPARYMNRSGSHPKTVPII